MRVVELLELENQSEEESSDFFNAITSIYYEIRKKQLLFIIMDAAVTCFYSTLPDVRDKVLCRAVAGATLKTAELCCGTGVGKFCAG